MLSMFVPLISLVVACSDSSKQIKMPTRSGQQSKTPEVSSDPQAELGATAHKAKVPPEDSLSLFKPSVYELTFKWCGGAACHAMAQAPVISHEDPAKALASVLKTGKVDFSNVERSRLYLRLSKEHHNCPRDLSCAAAAEKMLTALKSWMADLQLDAAALNLAKTSALSISAAVKSGDSRFPKVDELAFDVSSLLNIPEAKVVFLVDKAYNNTKSYMLSKPRLILPPSNDKTVQIRGMHFLRNEVYLADTTTFKSVDVGLTGAGGDLSALGTIIDHDLGPDQDKLKLAFDVIKLIVN